MKKRTQTSLNFVKKPLQPRESLQLSMTSYDDSNNQSLFKKSNTGKQNGYLSSILKNKNHNLSTDTMPRKRKTPIPQVKFQHYENTISNSVQNDYMIQEMKLTIHQLKKKDASYRLQISKLNKQLQMIAEEYSDLQSKVKQKDDKILKSNQYILKLDKQLRFYRDEVGKSDKLKSMYSKMMRVEEQNQQMRYVIEEQLKEIQCLKCEKDKNIYEDNQEIGENGNIIKTYPSSDSDRNYALEITMNPHAQYNYQHETQTSNYKGYNHLSTIIQDNSYNDDYNYTHSKGNYLNSINFSDMYKSKIDYQ